MKKNPKCNFPTQRVCESDNPGFTNRMFILYTCGNKGMIGDSAYDRSTQYK